MEPTSDKRYDLHRAAQLLMARLRRRDSQGTAPQAVPIPKSLLFVVQDSRHGKRNKQQDEIGAQEDQQFVP